jgi:hypothetical protein
MEIHHKYIGTLPATLVCATRLYLPGRAPGDGWPTTLLSGCWNPSQ